MKRAATVFQGVLIFIFFLIGSQKSFSQIHSSGLLFDGIDDYFTIPNNATYNFCAGDFTIELGVKIFRYQKPLFNSES